MTEVHAPTPPEHAAIPADSALPQWLNALPVGLRPFATLARWDRPVGIWLLFLPCIIGLIFNRLNTGLYLVDLGWVALFFIGALAMRGAGCTWNDITDKDIDAKVERTAARPIPSGQISLKAAYGFMAAQIAIGFVVWLALPGDAKFVALLSLPLVAAYPFMKRVTWWPQTWLGLTFNWGVLVGAATSGIVSFPVIILYAGLCLWTIAYDTIYALQDREDDALIGVRSTARLFGKRAVLFSFCFHMGAAALIALAAATNGSGRVGAVTALAFLAHGIWQVTRLKSSKTSAALNVFKSNVWAGALIAAGFLLTAIWPDPVERSLFADHEIVPDGPSETVTLPFGIELKRDHHPDQSETWLASDIARALEKSGIERPDPVDVDTTPAGPTQGSQTE